MIFMSLLSVFFILKIRSNIKTKFIQIAFFVWFVCDFDSYSLEMLENLETFLGSLVLALGFVYWFSKNETFYIGYSGIFGGNWEIYPEKIFVLIIVNL